MSVDNTVSMSASEYHDDPCPQPSLSSSIARLLIDRSPKHAWLAHPRLNPDFQRDEDSRMDLGTLAHSMLLEGDGSRVTWVDAEDWRTKASKEQRDAARASGKLPVLTKWRHPLEEMLRQAALTIKDSEFSGIFARGKAEQTITWREGSTYLRARPDLMDDVVVLDYKTTSCAEPEYFGRQIGRMGYDMQAAFYTRAISAVCKRGTAFVFLAQEIEPPYACSLVGLSNAYLEIGAAKVERAIRLWQYCLDRNEWPAYSTRVHYIEPPGWAVSKSAMEEYDELPA